MEEGWEDDIMSMIKTDESEQDEESEVDPIDWSDDKYHKPWNFTLKQLRDIFFVNLGRSKLKHSFTQEVGKINDATDTLDQVEKQISEL